VPKEGTKEMMVRPCHLCPAQAAMPQHNPSVLPEKFPTTAPKHRGNLNYLNPASTLPRSFHLWSSQTRTHSTNQRLPRKAGKRKKQPRNLAVSLHLHSWHQLLSLPTRKSLPVSLSQQCAALRRRQSTRTDDRLFFQTASILRASRPAHRSSPCFDKHYCSVT
jgi:hypothetical protein